MSACAVDMTSYMVAMYDKAYNKLIANGFNDEQAVELLFASGDAKVIRIANS